jgi:hypothetical protein
MDKKTKTLLIFGGVAIAGLALLVYMQSKQPVDVVVASAGEPKETWLQTGSGWVMGSDGRYVSYSGDYTPPAQSSSSGGGGISGADVLSGGATRLPGASYLNPFNW